MTVAVEEGQKAESGCGQERTAHAGAKPVAMIQSWAVVESVLSPSFAVLQTGNCLAGHVLGLAPLSYAKIAYTSPIVKIDRVCGLVETRHTTYRLGEMSEAYESWCGTRR